MNLKKIFALTVASATFAMAQTAAPAAPAEETAPATNVIASEATQSPAESPAAPATDVIANEATQPPAESSAPATNVIAGETKQSQAESPAAPATNVIASETKQSPAEPERKGPPKTPFTVLHGSVYNSVGNEAAADNVDILLNKRLTKFYGQFLWRHGYFR